VSTKQDQETTLISHLEALRRALIRSLLPATAEDFGPAGLCPFFALYRLEYLAVRAASALRKRKTVRPFDCGAHEFSVRGGAFRGQAF